MAVSLRHAPSPSPSSIVIASERTLIALDSAVDGRLVEHLWQHVSRNANFETLVGTMPAESAGRPLGFVLIGEITETASGASFSALVNGPRGFDVAAAGAPQHIAPTGSSPWLRTQLQHVTHVAIGPDAAGGKLPLGAGVVATSRVDLAIGETAPAQVTERRPNSLLLGAHHDAHDGHTVARIPNARIVTGEIRLADVPRTDPTVMFGYRVNGGQAFGIDLPHRFGRSPRSDSHGDVRLVPLISPTKTVSATHLDVRQIGDSVVVSDLGSTNGTSIMHPGGPWRRMAAGESVVVPPGTVIDLGDGNVIEIMPGVPLA